MSARHHPTVMTGISLLLPITLSTMAIVLLAPVLPRMLDEFGKMANADYLVPLLLTVQAACITVFSPFAGMLGDYFGRRRLLLWAFLAYAVVGVAPVFLHDFWAIMASRVGVGIAEALIATACGLGIAILSLIPLNVFTRKVARLQFELETAATNVELMMGANKTK